MILSLLLSAIVLHYAISLLLTFYPNLIHTKKGIKLERLRKCENNGLVYTMIHRGGPFYHLENTMAAFRFSEENKACALELDVHMTKDNKLVVFHDDELDRVFNKRIDVMDALHSDFKDPAESIPIHFNYKRRFKTEGIQFNQPTHPTLEEVLRGFPSQEVSIDLKNITQRGIDELERTLKVTGSARRCMIAINDSDLRREFMQKFPEASYFFITADAYKIFGAFFTGLLPYVTFEGDIVGLPFYTKAY